MGLCMAFVTAHGAPISYDETVDGDLPVTGPVTLHVLDVGVNTVQGSVSRGRPRDFDLFVFSVAPGLTLAAATVTNLSGDIQVVDWDFYYSNILQETLHVILSGSAS